MLPNSKRQPTRFVKWLAGERGSAHIERNPDNRKLQVVRKSRGHADEGVRIRNGKGRIEERSAESWKRTQQDHWNPRAPQPPTVTGQRGGGSATAGYHAPAAKRYTDSSHGQAHLLRLHAPNKPPQPVFSENTRRQIQADHAGKYYAPEIQRGRSRPLSLASHVSQGDSVMLPKAPAPPRSHVSVVSLRSHASRAHLVPVVVEYESGSGSHVSSHAGGSTRRSHAGTVVDETYDSGYTGSQQGGSHIGSNIEE